MAVHIVTNFDTLKCRLSLGSNTGNQYVPMYVTATRTRDIFLKMWAILVKRISSIITFNSFGILSSFTFRDQM